MKGYKKVCALRTFIGPGGRRIPPGGEAWLHDLAANATVRRGEAIFVGELTAESGQTLNSLMRELASLDIKISSARKILDPLESRRADVAERIAKLNGDWVEGEATEVDEDDESEDEPTEPADDDESELSLEPVSRMNRVEIVTELRLRGVEAHSETDKRSVLVAALKQAREE